MTVKELQALLSSLRPYDELFITYSKDQGLLNPKIPTKVTVGSSDPQKHQTVLFIS